MALKLRGSVDLVVNGSVLGWVYDENAPDERLTIVAVVNGVEVAQVVADNPRPDLAAAGIGDGAYGFLIRADHAQYLTDGDNRLHIYVRRGAEELDVDQGVYMLRRGDVAGRFEGVAGGSAYGWVAARLPGDDSAACVELLVDGEVRGRAWPTITRADLGRFGLADKPVAFEIRLPKEVFDGKVHSLDLRMAGSTQPLLSSPRNYQAHFEAAITAAHPHHILGWAVNKASPGEPITLDIHVNGELAGTVVANQPRPDMAARTQVENCGFSFGIPDRLRRNGHYTAVAMLPGTQRVIGAPVTYVSPELLARGLMAASEAMNALPVENARQTLSSARQVPPEVTAWMRREFFPKLLAGLRQNPGKVSVPQLDVPTFVASTLRQADDGVTDVIVPVYRGRAETIDCIESVLRNTGDAPFELVAVWDAGPEPELLEDLRALAAAGRITLLENEQNRGFTGSVNRGMSLHPHRDVLLLNSDAVTTPGWLARMRDAAYSAPNIGSVTPFSNRATICSFPAMPDDNDIPAGWTRDELAAAFARGNAGRVVDLPTAVGFAMYIRRTALDETGLFDEETWGRGYGEENDFCLRSAAIGWRHVLACDAFVEHHGSVSFAGDKNALAQKNLATLLRMYPDYSETVQRFIQSDPMAAARRPVLREIYQREAPAYILFVNHNLGGGTKLAVDTLIAQLRDEGQAVLMLTPRGEDTHCWRLARADDSYGMDYRVPDELPRLYEDLRALGVWHVHFHHLVGFTNDILHLPSNLGVRYDYSAHDYLPLCPRVNLIDATGRWCGEPPVSTCERCVREAGVFPVPGYEPFFRAVGGTAGAWRDVMRHFLSNARRVIVPSDDVAQRLRRHLGIDNLLVRPHPETVTTLSLPARAPVAATEKIQVAVIGAIGDHKGFFTLRDCVADAWRRGLPIQFTVIGYTQDDRSFARFDNITITGRYPHKQLGKLVEAFRCTQALFLSVCPETFSYTLSEAWNCGLLPVLPDFGAPAARVRSIGYGEIYDRTASAATINDTLLRIAARGTPAATLAIGQQYASMLNDYYDFAGLGQATGDDLAVCVLGMHRSGTSALAGALREGGLHSGDVLGFGVDNIKGHIEHREVIALDDALLAHNGGSWRDPPAQLVWQDAQRLRRDLFIGERRAEGGPWLFKDPRTLLTLPFWQEALPALKFVGTFRHPLAVAFSLYQRDALAITDGLRLWLDYNRRLLTLAREKKMPLLCFDLPDAAYRAALVRAIAALGITLDVDRASGFVAAELRHVDIPLGYTGDNAAARALLDETQALYDQLLTLSGTDHKALLFSADRFPLVPTTALCHEILSGQPDNTYALAQLAALEAGAGNHAAAIAARRRLVELAPGNYLAVVALLKALEAAGHGDEMLACAETQLARHPGNPDLQFRLGAARARRGDREQAVNHYAAARDAGFRYFDSVARLAALQTS